MKVDGSDAKAKMGNVPQVQSSNAVAEQKTGETDYKKLAQSYLSLVGQNVPKKVMFEFLSLAKTKQLNPFNREIYLVGYGQNWNVITGYEVYLKRAEATPNYDGFEFAIDRSDPDDISGTITIYRKDRTRPFKHTVYLNEVQGKKSNGEVTSMWKTRPRFMLEKVAIGQGFRLCFPLEFGGMPYTADEMGQQPQAVYQQPQAVSQEPQAVSQEPQAVYQEQQAEEQENPPVEEEYDDDGVQEAYDSVNNGRDFPSAEEAEE